MPVAGAAQPAGSVFHPDPNERAWGPHSDPSLADFCAWVRSRVLHPYAGQERLRATRPPAARVALSSAAGTRGRATVPTLAAYAPAGGPREPRMGGPCAHGRRTPRAPHGGPLSAWAATRLSARRVSPRPVAREARASSASPSATKRPPRGVSSARRHAPRVSRSCGETNPRRRSPHPLLSASTGRVFRNRDGSALGDRPRGGNARPRLEPCAAAVKGRAGRACLTRTPGMALARRTSLHGDPGRSPEGVRGWPWCACDVRAGPTAGVARVGRGRAPV